MSRPRAWMSWSSGKDSALALHRARTAGDVEVVGLLTTVNASANRVAMHAVRRELLVEQADSLGLPLHVVELPSPCSNVVYEQQMSDALAVAVSQGVEHMIFGDVYLPDVRAYREAMLAGTGIGPQFPLWGEPTGTLARVMLDGGVRAVVTCVDPAQAPASLAGRWYDARLLADLADSVDPCGENGEFHTFVVAGPGFAVLDTVDARALAEFYRQLLGMRYRPDSEPPPAGQPDPAGQEWLVLRSPDGAVTLAFQQVSELPAVTWPEGPQPQQMHLDLRVSTISNLDTQHERALALGARLREDRSTDPRSSYASTPTRPVTPSASSWTVQPRDNSAGPTACAASRFAPWSGRGSPP